MRKLKSALLGLVLLFLTCCAAVRPPGLPPAAPRDAVAAVVRYHAGVYWCSAVAIAPELAVTAAHCVRSTDAPVLEAAGQPARVVDSIGVVAGLDAALLHVRTPFTRWVTPAAEPLVLGARGWAVGYGCSGAKYVEARPLRYAGWEPAFGLDDYLGVACHGDSGGGVLNDAGELVGQLVAIGTSANCLGHAYATRVTK